MLMVHAADPSNVASPSSRRAWVEIARTWTCGTRRRVALLAEGVGRNIMRLHGTKGERLSPSSRRAWVEILWMMVMRPSSLPSPSSRRAWVEMSLCSS